MEGYGLIHPMNRLNPTADFVFEGFQFPRTLQKCQINYWISKYMSSVIYNHRYIDRPVFDIINTDADITPSYLQLKYYF